MLTLASVTVMVWRRKRHSSDSLSAQPSSAISSPAKGRTGQKPFMARNAPTPHGSTQAPAKNTCAPRTLSEQFGQISMRSGSRSTDVTMVTRNGLVPAVHQQVLECTAGIAVSLRVAGICQRVPHLHLQGVESLASDEALPDSNPSGGRHERCFTRRVQRLRDG